jgi:methyl coenzyme M reductase beta subunit
MRTLIKVGVAIAILYGVTNYNGGAIVQANDSKRTASGHASIHAYPDAIISATDAASGITVSVDRDGASVTARSSAGAILWHADVLKETGRPSVGFPVVRRIDITARGTASLVVGKHRFVEVDLKNGKMKMLGED